MDLLGGRDSQTFTYFKILLMQGFMELRKRVDSITFLLEIMMEESDLPCFPEFDLAVFRSRFLEKSTDKEVKKNINCYFIIIIVINLFLLILSFIIFK